MSKGKDNTVYEYVMAQLMVAYDATRRSKKGAMARIEKLGNKLVEQGLLTQEQADELLHY